MISSLLLDRLMLELSSTIADGYFAESNLHRDNTRAVFADNLSFFDKIINDESEEANVRIKKRLYVLFDKILKEKKQTTEN